MFHPIQRGELTDRLRRFFGLRGSYRADVDSVLAPVAIAQDISGPPWRQTGLRVFGARALAPGVGNMSLVQVVPLSGLVLVVDQIVMSCNQATAIWNVGMTVTNFAALTVDNQCPELIVDQDVTPAMPQQRVITSGTTPAAAAPSGSILLYALTSNAGTPLVWNTEIVVPGPQPGDDGTTGWCLRVNCAETANAYIGWSGKVYERTQL